jgi:3',5'-cyclic AMP phosphodiesterase CpdA
MRIILFADTHYAAGLITCRTRTCYQSLEKLNRLAREAGAADAYINLGDLINDTGDDAANRQNLDAALSALSALPAPCYSLTGNHDVEVAPRRSFTGRESDWFSFELGGLEWLALDCNYTHDGMRCEGRGFDWEDAALPPNELEWLRERVSAPGLPLVLLSHHPLCGDPADPHVIRNQAKFRDVLRTARRPVRALIQGHYHKGAVRELDGIPSWVLPALCERDGCPYAVADIENGELRMSISDLSASGQQQEE